ncbi:helix-turn-helix transcriptional regulator [Specibacter cremeus]|uniref:helix-turn-helix transcriptional regulator n=1 Tax=Specibacter cremeus TaxID=1629051 RepID=UPI000F76C3E6|nr:WYL domain-containing protein [Specibacter cremeus]
MPERIPAAERLLNLVIALLGSRYGRSKAFIRGRVNGYAPDPRGLDPVGAFDRALERDKDTLRSLGIPIITERHSEFDDEDSYTYRIDPAQYAVPDVRLDGEGLALLTVAARVWGQASFGPAARGALRKLALRSGVALHDDDTSVRSRIRTREPAFDPLWTALAGGHRVTFDYRRSGDATVTERTVEPWGLGNKYGQWYLSGRDVAAGGERLFRLSRIVAGVTIDTRAAFERDPGFRMADVLARLGTGTPHTALVDVPAGTNQRLRHEPRTVAVDGAPDGWDRLEVTYRDVELMADEFASLGAAALVREPDDLRRLVAGKLHAAAAASAVDATAVELTGRPRPRAVHTADSRDRLVRLLAMVPFLLANPGISVAAVAAEFDLGEAQLKKDLDLLIMCGLPGYYPGDLIDITWDDGVVFIRDADVLARPLRLSQDEACALLVGLAALAALPGGDAALLERVRGEVHAVAGDLAWLGDAVAVELVPDTTADTLRRFQSLVDSGHAVELGYMAAGRETVGVRVVEPLALFSMDSAWYLHAWCRDADGWRNFRLDRVISHRELDEPATSRHATVGPPEGSLYAPGPTDTEVVLLTDPRTADAVTDAFGGRQTKAGAGVVGVNLLVGSTAIVPPLIARLGGAARVGGPADVVATTRRWLADAVAAYPVVEPAVVEPVETPVVEPVEPAVVEPVETPVVEPVETPEGE